MKTKIFTYLVFCFVWQTNAQASGNTIVNENSSWATLVYGLGAYDVICCVETQYVYFEGDSTVAGISYKKVFSCNDRLHENIKYEGLIREQDTKTYFIPANSETEYLLYDFSLKERETFEYWDFRAQESAILYVSSVDLIEVNGCTKKRIQIKEGSDAGRIIDTWIEEIGSLSGILHLCPRLFLGGSVKELLCYFQNNELIYKNSAYSECYYDTPGDLASVQTIAINDCNIFPNPIDDIVTVSCLNKAILRIEIFDNLGKLVYSQANENTINIGSFPKGIYLIKMYDTNEQVSVSKIIKK